MSLTLVARGGPAGTSDASAASARDRRASPPVGSPYHHPGRPPTTTTTWRAAPSAKYQETSPTARAAGPARATAIGAPRRRGPTRTSSRASWPPPPRPSPSRRACAAPRPPARPRRPTGAPPKPRTASSRGSSVVGPGAVDGEDNGIPPLFPARLRLKPPGRSSPEDLVARPAARPRPRRRLYRQPRLSRPYHPAAATSRNTSRRTRCLGRELRPERRRGRGAAARP